MAAVVLQMAGSARTRTDREHVVLLALPAQQAPRGKCSLRIPVPPVRCEPRRTHTLWAKGTGDVGVHMGS